MSTPLPLVAGDRVRCVGELLTDVVAHLPENLAVASDTRASVRLTGGGAAANCAAWLAELGVPVALAARVGDDAAGRALLDDLARRGVDVGSVGMDPTRPTGACLVLVDAHGERTMVPDAGANLALTGTGHRTGEHLHLSAYALFHDGVRDLVLEETAVARAAGATVSIDVASAAPLRQFGPDTVRGWCADALVLANLDEAHVLTGRGHAAAAALELARWGRAAVVKCGRDGAYVARDDTVERVPVPRTVEAVIDTTGAGDAFAAGLLAALMQGATLLAATASAHEVAREAITRVGARP
ncbi:carbohydrate kinase family protein [Jatrophihabitans sp. YIM 134969]